MKKGWQQIMLYLIVLTSYGCLSDEDKCIRQLHMVALILAQVFSTLSLSGPA